MPKIIIKANNTMELEPAHLDLTQLRYFLEQPKIKIQLIGPYQNSVKASHDVVKDILAKQQTVYGVNTGFGRLAQTKISNDDLIELQNRLVLSHAAGTGPLFDNDTVRLILLLKLLSLARGYSGVRLELITRLLDLLNSGVYPCIPSKGSVGASGDLAPLAHLSCAVIGVGEVNYQGQTMPAIEALKQIGMAPMVLGPKEGIALLNGCQVSCALAIQGFIKTENCFNAALLAGALTTDATLSSSQPFDHRIHRVRPHQGQQWVAKQLTDLLCASGIRSSHQACHKVQDPYSIRCQPQVMGACFDVMKFALEKFICEANAVSDNPLVFADDQVVLSGGNFHGEPIALAADALALAIAEIGALSERRIALLMDSNLSQLPPFLATHAGLDSGFMIAQVTAAALCSENKQQAHPASVDSIPTSANQEDHVSMATHGARRLMTMAENTATVIAIELLAACQGLDIRAPLTTSEQLQQVVAKVRAKVGRYDQDRFMAPDIEAIKQLVMDGTFNQYIDTELRFSH